VKSPNRGEASRTLWLDGGGGSCYIVEASRRRFLSGQREHSEYTPPHSTVSRCRRGGSGGCLAPLGLAAYPYLPTWQALTIEKGAGCFSQHHSSGNARSGWASSTSISSLSRHEQTRILIGCMSIRANGAKAEERDSYALPATVTERLNSTRIKRTLLRVPSNEPPWFPGGHIRHQSAPRVRPGCGIPLASIAA